MNNDYEEQLTNAIFRKNEAGDYFQKMFLEAQSKTADIIKTGNTYPVGTLLDSRATSKEYRKAAVALLELAEAARDMDEAVVAYNNLYARIEASKTA